MSCHLFHLSVKWFVGKKGGSVGMGAGGGVGEKGKARQGGGIYVCTIYINILRGLLLLLLVVRKHGGWEKPPLARVQHVY